MLLHRSIPKVMTAWIMVSAAQKESDGQTRANVLGVEESSSGDFNYELLKREIVVKEDSEVATTWGGKEGGVVYGEAEVVF